MPLYAIFLLVVAFLLGIVALGYGYCWDAIRIKRLSGASAQIGLRFRAKKDKRLTPSLPGFGLFHKGHDRYASNVMSGRLDGRKTLAFDYHYVTGQDGNRRRYEFSAVVVEGLVALEGLLIRPQRAADSVAGFFCFDDINFESAEFSREFFVGARDRRWAHDVIHPRMMEFLLEHRGFHIRLGDRHVIVYSTIRFAPSTFPRAIATAHGILDRLPKYVIAQQSEGLAPCENGKGES